MAIDENVYSRTSIVQVALVIALASSGGLVKILGGVLYGSKALLVDALTCIANLVALVASIHYYRVSLTPPDEDHHFGHHRLGFGGALVSTLAYSFIAGAVVVDLAYTSEYTVSILAPLFAGLGFILYLGAIIVSKRISQYFRAYALFTYSELIESATVIAASLGGALYSFYIDYAGAVVLTTYIFYEVYSVVKDLFYYLSDIAPPKSFVDEVRGFIESKGYTVDKIRVRMVSGGYYHGELVIKIPASLTAREVDALITELARDIRRRYNIDLVISIKTSQ